MLKMAIKIKYDFSSIILCHLHPTFLYSSCKLYHSDLGRIKKMVVVLAILTTTMVMNDRMHYNRMRYVDVIIN